MEGIEPALPPVVPSVPSRRPPPWKPPPPLPSWKPGRAPPSPTSEDKSSAEGGVVTGLVIGFLASLLVLAVLYSLYTGRRDSRARARAGTVAWAAAVRPALDDDERQVRRASATRTTSRRPSFTYTPSMEHTMTGNEEETAMCSVCLAALQLGEMVRLLPACMHLFHMECIDPWLDAHSTCPICRSDTNPSMDVAQLPPVS
ncbi:unnamed protein product [Alopecurus aequalis]